MTVYNTTRHTYRRHGRAHTNDSTKCSSCGVVTLCSKLWLREDHPRSPICDECLEEKKRLGIA